MLSNKNQLNACVLLICLSCFCAAGDVSADTLQKSSSRQHKAKLMHVGADEGQADPSFASFRSSLLKAIESHDRIFVEDCLSPEILTALGGEKGKQAFLNQWEGLSEESRFWKKMQAMLMHGVQYDEGTREFHAPAVTFDDSHSELPQAVVWDTNTVMCKLPNDSSSIPHSIYDEQVTLLDPAEPIPNQKLWSKIRLKDGSSGYVKSQHLYGAYDEFAVFKRLGGHWQISWFGYACL